MRDAMVIFYFHIRLLMVFLGFRLDLSFCLHISLQKMSKFYQLLNKNPETNLFHHGLIHTLVECHLASVGDS
jgi:hypothetical protein